MVTIVDPIPTNHISEPLINVFDVLVHYMCSAFPYESDCDRTVVALKDVYLFIRAISERKPSLLHVKPLCKGGYWDISSYQSFKDQFCSLWPRISETFTDKSVLILETRTAYSEECQKTKEYYTLRSNFTPADFINKIQLKQPKKIPLYFRNTFNVPNDIAFVAKTHFQTYSKTSPENIYQTYCV